MQREWDDYQGELDEAKVEAGRRARSRSSPPLARELLAHVLRTGRRGDALVFGRTDSEPFVPTTARSRALRMWERENARRMAAAADPDGATPLVPISLHEGRHTYASALIAARANPEAVQSLMGHAAIRRTDLAASATRTDGWTAREAAGCLRWPALAAVGRFGGGLLPAWIPLLTRPGEDLANSPAPVAVVTPGCRRPRILRSHSAPDCRCALRWHAVDSVRWSERRSSMATKSHARLAAWAAAAILVVIAGFQFYWGLGGTWGAHEASGGAMDELSTSEQFASAIAGIVLLAFAGIVLVRVGYWRDHVPFAIARIGTWVIAVLLLLGALVNLTAQTDFERFVNGPVALLVALLTFVVARCEAPVSPTRRSAPPTPKPGTPTPVH